MDKNYVELLCRYYWLDDVMMLLLTATLAQRQRTMTAPKIKKATWKSLSGQVDRLMLVRGRLLEDSIRSDADYTDYFSVVVPASRCRRT